jgi:hypothetical protein
MDDTENNLRRQVAVILEFGVTKRALAERLDVHESWLGRWFAGDAADIQVRPMSVPEMDRLRTYVREFTRRLQETQRPYDGSAGTEFPQPTGTTPREKKP